MMQDTRPESLHSRALAMLFPRTLMPDPYVLYSRNPNPQPLL